MFQVWRRVRLQGKSSAHLAGRRAAFLGLSLLFTLCPFPARAASIFRLTADKLAFYSNLYIVTGYGNVRVDLRNGSKISGDSFFMDLRLQRFVVAGVVKISTPGASYDGAALSTNFDSGISYFVSLEGQPQRLTFADARFQNPQAGAQVAADAFSLPVLENSPASIIGTKATIGVGSYLRFDTCRTQILGGFKYYFPLPACYINFSSDPNLSQNSLAGANVGGRYKFTGNANAISSILVNYDSTNKIYGAFEQNFSSPKAWAVFSVNPLTKSTKTLSGIASYQPSETLGIRASTQYHTLDLSSTNDITSFVYSNAQVTQSAPLSYVQLNYSTGKAWSQGFGPSFTTTTQLSVQSSDVKLGPAPFFVNVAGGYGATHGSYSLQTLGGTNYTTLWFDYANMAIFAPSLTIGNHSDPGNLVSFDLEAEQRYQWYSLPHHVNQTTTAVSVTKSFHGKASLSLGYKVSNVGDIYPGAQREAYPSYAPVQGPGYAAFEGLATFRTLSVGTTYTPSAKMSLALTFQKHTDFPGPIQNFFALAPTPPLGVNPYPYYLGQPPYDLTGAARLRLNEQLSIDLQDTYYFNYQGVNYSGIILQVRP